MSVCPFPSYLPPWHSLLLLLPSFIILFPPSCLSCMIIEWKWADVTELEILIRNHLEDSRFCITILIGFQRLKIWGDWKHCSLLGQSNTPSHPLLWSSGTSSWIPKLRIRRRGLIDSLMCFVDAAQDRANPTPTPLNAPTKQVPQTPAAVAAPPPKVITPDDFEDVSYPSPVLV